MDAPIVFTSDPNTLIPPSCPEFPPLNVPGVLCEGFDAERNGVAGFQWSRLPVGSVPGDPLRALGDQNDDVLGYTINGGPSPAGTAGATCSEDTAWSFVNCQGPMAIENDWHLHSPFEGPGAGFAGSTPGYYPRPDVGQADGGKAHSGVRSMHMGRHLDASTTVLDTLSLRQVSAFVLDSQGDPNVPGIIAGSSSTLEFWHLISVPDDENFGNGFIPAGTSFGGGQVQISVMGDDGRFQRWQRLNPFVNAYDSVDHDPISICAFDPGDDGPGPSDETMCDSPFWSDLGDVHGTDPTCTTDTDGNDPEHKDCGAISGCTPGPGCTETGSLGVGVWARSAFDLSPYAGRVARLRWIGMVEGGWSFGTDRSALEASSIPYQYYDGDDGWWVDDIVLTGLQREPGACTAADDDGDGFTECQLDCDDTHAGIYPGAPQVCGDGVNNNCGDAAWPLAHDDRDADADGLRPCQGDCDDAHASVYPGAPQVCDGLNNDCNDAAWPAPLAGDTDADSDGVPNCGGDCDESDPSVYPGAPEICGDAINNDCNDPGWPALPPGEADADSDGVLVCQGDCDDTRGGVYPGAQQVCGDGVNNDCNDPVWPVDDTETDADGDGQSRCQGDCDDANPAVRAGAPEVCDGIRNDCSVPWNPDTETDNDLDGRSECDPDCDDGDATSWAPPGSVPLVVSFDAATGVTTFSWDPPVPLGGTLVVYDLLEADQPYDFRSSVCLESDATDAFFEAPPVSPWPGMRFYVVRAQNGCAGTEFRSIGTDSSGFPRTGRHCNAGSP